MADTAAERTGGEISRGVRIRPYIVLVTLFAVSLFAYADRSIMTVVQEPLKADLGLSDTQLGMLTGPIFAVFYAVVGIPVARLAERANRKRIIAAALALWSLATALCGAATNFLTLAVARASVGGGEAASPPASHSTISDYFPAQQRGRAMSILNISIPLGIMLGTAVGGLVTHAYGWRTAFVVMGVLGLLLAVIAMFVLVEPTRGAQEHGEKGAALPPIKHAEAFKILLSSRTFWLLLIASSMAGNASHGLNAFSASFLMRQHGLTLLEVTGVLGLGKSLIGLVGALAGGFLADKLSRIGTRSYLIVPAVGGTMAGLLLLVAFNQDTWAMAAALFVPAFFFANWIPSPSFAAVQNMVDVRLRATASAVLLFFITVVGSVGPLIVGAFSDGAAAAAFQGDYDASCPGGRAAAGATAAVVQACQAASAQGLTSAMYITGGLYAALGAIMALAVLSTGRNLKL